MRAILIIGSNPCFNSVQFLSGLKTSTEQEQCEIMALKTIGIAWL
ncbi:hypothetical protein [Dendronalium sp. ChiSLP03b]|nr:hypothetical protein [Dendronalium sp. ChiSLP03b]